MLDGNQLRQKDVCVMYSHIYSIYSVCTLTLYIYNNNFRCNVSKYLLV